MLKQIQDRSFDPDHFGLGLGDWVIALSRVESDLPDGTKQFHGGPGSIGHVVGLEQGCFPTIFWESTQSVTDCHAGEVRLLCGPDFARFPHTTPGFNR
jgi:hypothetical protein